MHISKKDEEILKKRWLKQQSNRNDISNIEIHVFAVDVKNTFTDYQYSISYQIQMGCSIEFAEDNGLRDTVEYDCTPKYYGNGYD